MSTTQNKQNSNKIKKSNVRKTLLDFYAEGNYPVDKKTFKLITKKLFDKMLDDMILRGACYKLPKRLGSIMVRKRKTKTNRVVDFYNTKKYGVCVYHNNWHSEGYYAFVHWDKDLPLASFANKRLFEFSFVRRQKRRLAKSIKEGNTISKYLEIE